MCSASAACRALDRLAQTNPRLRTYLKDLEEAKREALRQKEDELRGRFGDDPSQLAALASCRQDLERQFKALLLLPESGLLRELIERLEEAGQSDGGQAPGEAELLALLRAVQGAIDRIDKSRPEAWKQVAEMIETRRSDAPTHSIRELDPANKRPI